MGISEIAALLAIETGESKSVCLSFIFSLFETIKDELKKGNTVKIKNLGTFRLVEVESRKSINISTGEQHEIPAHKKITFIPSKRLAEIINRPFEGFETVEIENIEDTFNTKDSEQIDKKIDNETKSLHEGIENELGDNRFDEQSQEEDLDDMATSEAYLYGIEKEENIDKVDDLNEGRNKEENDGKEEKSKESIESSEAIQDPSEDLDSSSQEEMIKADDSSDKKNYDPSMLPMVIYTEEASAKFGYGFFWGVVCSVLVLGTIFLIGVYNGWYGGSGWGEREVEMTNNRPNENDLEEITQELPQVNVTDTINKSITTEPLDTVEPVYDTVSTTRYLTYISRDHYGNFHFWPYIYEENKAILGHPNRIKPGTRVVVPDLKKYGVDPKNKKDIEIAKKKEAEIYRRFKD